MGLLFSVGAWACPKIAGVYGCDAGQGILIFDLKQNDDVNFTYEDMSGIYNFIADGQEHQRVEDNVTTTSLASCAGNDLLWHQNRLIKKGENIREEDVHITMTQVDSQNLNFESHYFIKQNDVYVQKPGVLLASCAKGVPKPTSFNLDNLRSGPPAP